MCVCVDVAVGEEIQLTCVQTADSVEFLGWDVYPSKSTMQTPITFEQGSRYIHVHTVDSTLLTMCIIMYMLQAVLLPVRARLLIIHGLS